MVAVNQNFFETKEGKPFHELGFYYIVEAVNKRDVKLNDYVREELDKGKIQHLEFKWFTAEQLKEIDFRPKFIADCLNTQQTIINITRDWLIIFTKGRI